MEQRISSFQSVADLYPTAKLEEREAVGVAGGMVFGMVDPCLLETSSGPVPIAMEMLSARANRISKARGWNDRKGLAPNLRV